VPSQIVVEIANTHEGSLGIATSLVEMAADTGADAVKFQMHLGEHEGVLDEAFRIKFSMQDQSRRDYWDRVNFRDQDWSYLSNFCAEKKIEFMCTPFSIEAAKKLLSLTKIKRWKVGSGDASNFPFIDFLISTKLPLIISTGLLSWQEILVLRQRLQNSNAWERTTLMHCVSMYPTPLEFASLNLLEDLRALGGKIGLSDHSGKLTPSLYALSKGVDLIEVHMTPHTQFFGPDVTSSLIPSNIKQIVDYKNELQIIQNNPMSKSALYSASSETRLLFRKGIYWKRDVKAGEKVSIQDFSFLKPSHEIDSIDFEMYIGKTLKRKVSSGNPLSPEDFCV
jgi:N,N'-diacetyllegionaminate synthase